MEGFQPMTKWVITGVIICCLMSGCSTPDRSAYVRDGIQYGVTEGVFRGRWWSYYERGTSFLSGKFYEEAAADFETALINRSRDSWRARTYGLHFTNYFPNRELGVAYYYMGRYEEAAAQLESALDMVDTARGHYYLGHARRALIAQGMLDDRAAPSVTTTLSQDTLLNDPFVPIEITATDDLGVAEVRLNDRILPQRAARTAVQFREELVLREGTHDIEIAARDLADKDHVETRRFTVDMTGPTIGFFAPLAEAVIDTPTVTIEGVTVDDHGVASVTVNDRVVATADGAKRLPFHTDVALEPGENRIRVTARDMAGNETHGQVVVFHGDTDGMAAHLWLLKQRDPALLMLAEQSTHLAALPDVPDAEDRIVLRSPRPDQPNRHNRAVRVAGEVTVTSGVDALLINDEPFDQLTGAPREVFSQRIPIEDETLLETGGRMTVTVAARDKDGQSLEEAVDVELRPISLNTLESRMPVAVLAFEGHAEATAVSDRLRLGLEEKLLSRRRFRTLDRTQLQAVLTEHELASALGNPAEAIRLGQVTPAHVFLIGDVFPHGDGMEIKVRIISTETTDVLGIIDGYAEAADSSGFDRAAEALATELERLFPRLSGELLAIRERGGVQELYFDWTSADGLQPGTYALIVHEEPAEYDEVLGEYFGPYITEVGRARIEDIADTMTRGRPTDILTEEITLEQGMAAITM